MSDRKQKWNTNRIQRILNTSDSIRVDYGPVRQSLKLGLNVPQALAGYKVTLANL